MKQIVTGVKHVLAVNKNGDLLGIGFNEGELGLGDKTRRSQWTKISAFEGLDIQQLQCGSEKSAVLTNRGLFVMGKGIFGGKDNKITIPTRIELDNITNISLRRRLSK